MPDELITIAKFHNMGEAKLAQGKLNSAGIAARVGDENMVNLHLGIVVGGIRLQVPDSQVVRALEVLDDFSPGGSEGEEEDDTETIACCPECESLEIRKVAANGPKQIALWSAAIPFPELQQGELLHRWKCLACGYEWEAAEE
jgi:rubredoxin